MLALNAAFGACSAALVADGERRSSAHCDEARGAAAALPGLVAGMLATAPVFDAVAVTIGPGSFTGIRAGLALAHGLALGAGVPIVGVTTIEALMSQFEASLSSDWVNRGAVWVAIEDGRGRFFLARREPGSPAGAVEVADLRSLPNAGPKVTVVGDAAPAVAATLRLSGRDATASPIAAIDILHVARVGAARLAGRLPPLPPQPWYLEPPEVRTGAAPRPAPV